MRKLWLLLFFLPFSRAQDLGNGQFPIMAWDFVDDPKVLQLIRDAGVNSVAFVRPKTLDACQRLGLKCIVFDERLAGEVWSKPFNGEEFRRNLAIVLKEVNNNPAVYGYHIKDEPNQKEFPELAKAVAAVKELAPGKWPYINLFPGQGETYDKYIDDFVQICAPTALSYDRYSVIGDKGSGDFDTAFWMNLAQMRDHAVEHKLPMWNIVLTSPHWRFRELTSDDIRLQVWGSLVYGVKGIAYYKFISREVPILHADDLGNFRDGPLDQFYEKTPTWDWLRNVDRQVQNLAPVLLKLHSDDVYHIGAVPRHNHGPAEKSLVQDIPDGDIVAGDFTHENGQRYVMLVNKSLKRSVHCMPRFQSGVKSVKYVSPITGELKPFEARFYWLAPGQGVLLQVE